MPLFDTRKGLITITQLKGGSGQGNTEGTDLLSIQHHVARALLRLPSHHSGVGCMWLVRHFGHLHFRSCPGAPECV